MEIVAFVVLVLIVVALFVASNSKGGRSTSAGSTTPRRLHAARGDDEPVGRDVLDRNMEWLRERWARAEQARAQGQPGEFPKWYWDEVTGPQSRAIADVRSRLPDTLTKGQASDVIGLFSSIADHQDAVLSFFKVKLPPDERNETRAASAVAKLLSDPDKKAEWEARPAGAEDREFFRYFSVKVPAGLTQPQADAMKREVEGARTDEEIDAWSQYLDTFGNLNDECEEHGIKRVSFTVYRAAVEAIKASAPGAFPDEAAIAAKILEQKPDMARVAR